MDEIPQGLALVWADVAEFTSAMEASEQSMTVRTLGWVDRCVNGWLDEMQGHFLQHTGDAILLSFETPESALLAAQRLRQDWMASGTHLFTTLGRDLRIALHWGSLTRGSHGYVAHSLNQLARLAQIGRAHV